MKSFSIQSQPEEIFQRMLKDIERAKKSVYLETYIYDKDIIGDQFRKALIKKAKEGILVKVLVDAWGSGADREYFKELQKAGGKVRFFRELRYVIRIFTKNHERNHRKLLVIDGKIGYVGSMNITATCLDWRELVIRLEGDIVRLFIRSFLRHWHSPKRFVAHRLNVMAHEGFSVIQDVPSLLHRTTEKRYIKLLKKAKHHIMIETPYFIPSQFVINALSKAVKRGVKVTIVIPHRSDVRIVDIMRNIHLGRLHKAGIEIFFYKARILHSKLLIVDDQFFLLGSSNVDYRSFLYQYEINLIGNHKGIIDALQDHYHETLKYSEKFSYKEWKERSSMRKMIELLGSLIEKYF